MEAEHELNQLRPAVATNTRCLAAQEGGQRWEWDGVRFEILHPRAEDYAGSPRSNALSCVLRVSNGRRTALLTGDIEAAQEASLVERLGASGALKADLLLVPHHGSKTSSTQAFLAAVNPDLALAQAGYRNRFGHPAPVVAQRYRELQIPLIVSADCGAALWRSAAPSAILCQRESARRYWHHQSAPG